MSAAAPIASYLGGELAEAAAEDPAGSNNRRRRARTWRPLNHLANQKPTNFVTALAAPIARSNQPRGSRTWPGMADGHRTWPAQVCVDCPSLLCVDHHHHHQHQHQHQHHQWRRRRHCNVCLPPIEISSAWPLRQRRNTQAEPADGQLDTCCCRGPFVFGRNYAVLQASAPGKSWPHSPPASSC